MVIPCPSIRQMAGLLQGIGHGLVSMVTEVGCLTRKIGRPRNGMTKVAAKGMSGWGRTTLDSRINRHAGSNSISVNIDFARTKSDALFIAEMLADIGPLGHNVLRQLYADSIVNVLRQRTAAHHGEKARHSAVSGGGSGRQGSR